MVKQKNWDPAAKKRMLIDAAIEVLNKKDYSKALIDEIARTAGVAKGTVYLYFKSKEEIYFSVIFALMDKMKEAVEEVKSTGLSATEQLKLLLKKVLEFTSRNSQIFNALRNETKPYKDKFHNELHKKIFELNRTMCDIIEAGIRNNEFKAYPPQLISGVFFSAASMIGHQQIEGDRTFPQIPVDMLFEIITKGFSK